MHGAAALMTLLLPRCMQRIRCEGRKRVAMLRGNPTLILDSCSVRAKRSGDRVGPNPTDRGKMGSKYYVAINGCE